MMNNSVWYKVNTVYAAATIVVGLLWLTQLHTFAIVIGLVAISIAYFLYKRPRWAYFAAAILYFGLLRTAMDDGNDFYQGLQSVGKLVSLVGVIFALILHEKVAIKSKATKTENIPE